MSDVRTFQQHIQEFQNLTIIARELSERDRDYKDNRQWSEKEAQKLRARNQAPIVDNRIKPKVEGLKGLLIQRRSDPKAYARTRAHEESSEAVTDALRYVADATNFDDLELEVFDNLIVEGYGGCIVDISQRNDEIVITPTLIPWDRIYFDPYSRRSDFKDARYMGIMLWMDVDVVKAMFPNKSDAIDRAVGAGSDVDETFEDRPSLGMVSEDRERILVAQEFYLEGGVWHMVIFTGDEILEKPAKSTYKDEFGFPENPIELVGAYINRDNERFGEVRYWIDPQNEINHRRSKFLFMLSSRQTKSKKGTIKDVPAMKRELAKPDGHIEFEGEDKDFGVIQTGDMAEAQFKLFQDAKASLDSVSFNAQLSGERQGNLSGVAVESLQMAGMLETNSLFSAMTSWKKRVFRQVWYRIKQHWTQEKWIRVTDDYDKLRWVGINVPITRKQQMEEFINDESQNTEERRRAAQLFMQMVEAQDPRLEEMVQTQNPIAELDMDIILSQSANSINVQQEQFRMLYELAASRKEIPLKSLLKLSEIRDKEDLIKDIDEREQAVMAAEQKQQQFSEANAQLDLQGKQIDNQKKAGEIDKVAAETTDKNMDAITKQVKNQLLIANPDPTPQSIS